MAGSFVEIQNIKKQYNPPKGAFAVGKDGGVDLEIQKGEIFSLLGPNGAGKSTLINMMSGLLTPTDGDVIISGSSIRKEPLTVKQMIGVVPQELAIYPRLSARQNLEFFGKLYGLMGSELKKQADKVLELIGLEDRANDKIEEYSGGMKRRVNIGVGLMHDPEMLFLDEPTVAIDPQSRRKILDTVKLLNEQYGLTVLYTTHYMEEAQELSDRIAIIDYGKIIATGSLDGLIETVGEYDTIVMTVPDANEDSVSKISLIDGVENGELLETEENLRFIAKDGRKVLPEIIRTVNELGLTLHSIEVQEPNLEAVFLNLTGRALRD